ncbi:helix-turn-helix domain-containing protein [Salmonella enterica subsp. enterica serovar Give]|uniref:helix-turn-helix domain-containing protein n=1 Tax=Salmonella enterica TaxID=28901 RepID=UPI002FF4B098
MRKLYDYILDVKRYTRLNTNIKIAEYLDVSRQYITTLKYGKCWLSSDKCLKIAEALGIDADEIILAINVEKSDDSDIKSQWAKLVSQKKKEINVPEEFKPDGSPRRRMSAK